MSTETVSNKHNEEESKTWHQWLAALTIQLLSLVVGLINGWSSPFIAKLTNGTEVITLTKTQISWAVSLAILMRPVGSLLAALIIRKLGVKKALLLAAVPFTLGWSCFLISISLPSIYLVRLLCGCATGMYFSSYPMFISEVASPRIRGALISMIVQGMVFGIFLGNLIGVYVNLYTYAIISLVPSTLFIFTFFWFPETPHRLVRWQRFQEAEVSLRWYRHCSSVTHELKTLKSFTAHHHHLTFKEFLQAMKIPVNQKIVTIVVAFYIFQHLSGMYTINMYMETILTSLKVKIIAPALVVACVSFVGFLAGLMSIYTSDHFGRRPMLSMASLGLSIDLFLIGLNYLLLKIGYDSSALQYLSIICVLFFSFFLYIGILPIPCCLIGELLPPQLKEYGSCSTNIIAALLGFMTNKTYQPMLDATSDQFVYWFYAFILFLMFIYAIIILPETKGKSLQEIQEMLVSENNTSKVPASNKENK